VITQSQINLREYLSLGQLIKQDIDTGKRILVFDGYSIEQMIIYARYDPSSS
jgi:hypothetical protein